MTEPVRLRKRPLEAGAATIARAADQIDIAGCATIAYSSEDPARYRQLGISRLTQSAMG